MEFINVELDEEMEMPCPCQKCGKWFDLNDGISSEKWFPDTVICEECGQLEEKITDLEDELADVKSDYEEAKWGINHYGNCIKEIEAELKRLGAD